MFKFLILPTLICLLVSFNTHEETAKTKNELINFPLHVQPDHIKCGPTCIQMVLEYNGIKKNITEISKESKTDLFTNKGKLRGGTLPDFVKKTLDHFGVPSEIKSCNLNDLKMLVDSKRPPIVVLRSSRFTWHYVVVTGYDGNSVIIANPAGGDRQVLPISKFEGCWNFTRDMNDSDDTELCRSCSGYGTVVKGLEEIFQCRSCNGKYFVPDICCGLLELVGVEPNMCIVQLNK